MRNIIRACIDSWALYRLARETSDYTIEYRDWPRHGLQANAHYTVTAVHFFAYGKGKGRTLGQATRRAIAQLERKDALIPRAAFKDVILDLEDDTPQ